MPPKKSPLDEAIDHEISLHGRTWCSPDCKSFLPSFYRRARRDGLFARSLQEDRSTCHVASETRELSAGKKS